VYEALDAHGFDPRGPIHKFRAKCPAHDGDDHNLLVKEGLEGNASVHCFVYDCKINDILRPLGLTYRDLLRPGESHARSIDVAPPPPPARRAKKLMDVLALLDEIHEPWMVMVSCDCMFCGAQGAWLRTRAPRQAVPAYTRNDPVYGEIRIAAQPAEPGGGLYIDCPNGCRNQAFMQGLKGKVMRHRERPLRTRPAIEES
jgi:hypothetical protein